LEDSSLLSLRPFLIDLRQKDRLDPGWALGRGCQFARIGTVGFVLDDAEFFGEGEVRFGALLGEAMVFCEELFFVALLGDNVVFGALLEEAGFIFVGLLNEAEFCFGAWLDSSLTESAISSVSPESLVET